MRSDDVLARDAQPRAMFGQPLLATLVRGVPPDRERATWAQDPQHFARRPFEIDPVPRLGERHEVE